MRYQISRVLKREQVMKLTTGNCSRPKNVLGRHLLEHGQVIAAFHPEAVRMTLCIENGEEYPMDMVERQPVFALFLPCRQAFSYQIVMEYGDGKQMVIDDPYSFDCQITGKEEAKFLQGKWPEAYCKLGAHPMTVGGTEGAYFALWMPGVKRVSVLGSFNQWDSAMYPMNRMENAEIYELFLPGVKEGEDYCFEIKTMQDRIFRIADPFGLAKEPGVKNISKILNIHALPWMDDVWMANRRSRNGGSGSMVISMMAEDTKGMDDFLQETCTHILISQQKRENMGCREAILGQSGRCLWGDDEFSFIQPHVLGQGVSCGWFSFSGYQENGRGKNGGSRENGSAQRTGRFFFGCCQKYRDGSFKTGGMYAAKRG